MLARRARWGYWGAFAALLVTLSGTAHAATGAGASPYEFADPDTLIRKANTLGESELSRLAAAEMVYRDKLYVHMFRLEISSGMATQVWIKLYRQFTGFEVLDIERTPSVLNPLKVTIRFDFKRIGTRRGFAARNDLVQIQKLENDVSFVVHDVDTVTREYFCTPQGDPVELPSPVLPRPHIFVRTNLVPAGDWWIEDPHDPPSE